jgi:hypothetical protein
MDVHREYEERKDGLYVWIDPDTLPPMLQETAGGWHKISNKVDNSKKEE